MTSSPSLSANAMPIAASKSLPRVEQAWRVVEESLAAVALVAMVLLPIAEILVRAAFVTGIPGAGPLVQHLTLWVGFIGASLAARDDRLLSIATGTLLPAPVRPWTAVFAACVTAAVTTALGWGAVQLVVAQREMGSV